MKKKLKTFPQKFAKEMILRLVSSYPNLIDEGIDGLESHEDAEIIGWLREELFYLLATNQGAELKHRARYGTPDA